MAIQGACAHQTSDNNLGVWTFSGWSQGNCSIGYEFCDMDNTLTSRGSFSTSTEESRNDVRTSGQLSSGNQFTISAISGSMQATAGMIASFSVKAWLPANENDTTIDANELLYNGTIVIRFGQVDLLENFATDFVSKYSTTTNGSAIQVNFNGSNLVFRVPVPRGRSIDEVSIMGEVDGAPIAPDGSMMDSEGMRFMAPTAVEKIQNGNVKFNVFPNPSKSGFNLFYNSKTDSDISVKLFNSEGKLVKELIQGSAKKEEEIKLNTNELFLNLLPGTYFIILDDGKDFYTKQQVIND